jgi:hypothetical protein
MQAISYPISLAASADATPIAIRNFFIARSLGSTVQDKEVVP